MSLADANRKYFDNIGDSYDKFPWFAKVNQQVTDALRGRLNWLGIPLANTGSSSDVEEVRLLDYACGPGLMSRIFGPYVTITTGVDVSPNMIATYNARARSAGLPESTISGVVGDLFASPPPPELSGPEYHSFDLATVGFGFHHFDDVIHAAKVLKQRLRPGGVLVINEFLEGGDIRADENGEMIEGSGGDLVGKIQTEKHEDHRHHHGHGHGHGHDHGKLDFAHNPSIRKDKDSAVVVPHFTIDGIKKFFAEAGFVDVDIVVLDEKVYMEFAGMKLWRTVLFAKGRRPFEDEVREKSEL
ncbi:S-adenosyl-L-methionine-dependent methyltransferase [Melanomma pulvis-pyrius CBS 109.77]|uniref:S-adenosyl-L-methionine-dependent methyltransferase n=1 Tax=Melanomma pulvis-pyrius CBS 109.77 TaxID=1314802 RepID=A0A6A6XR81_9PLEO|nr:S-adenosyl-L-methionine-dependent methyltransferase [Melanomma pulvis-pyrius CBS 109.77]